MNVKARVLIVDDEPQNVKFLSELLSSAGYAVLEADNGHEAISVAKRERPDLILFDSILSGLNGPQVTKELKNESQTKNIPILLVRPIRGGDDSVQGFAVGGDDFLLKTTSGAEFLAGVKSLVSQKKLQEQQQLQPLQASFASPSKNEGNEYILVIEDNPVLLRQYETALREEGHRVETVLNGQDALAILSQRPPALIILDLVLPDIHGLELLQHIRADTACRFCSVIIISSLGDLATKLKGIDGGADDYLQKPVHLHELKARVRASLRKYSAQHKMEDELYTTSRQANMDPLTQLNNRKYFDESIEQIFAETRDDRGTFSLLLLDLDHFKNINDTLGHVVGDHVLQELAGIMKGLIKGNDILCRYGGEEFTVILPNTRASGAVVVAEQIRAAVEKHSFASTKGQGVTISIGVTEVEATDHDISMIVARADDALYQAKEHGRNQVRES